MINYKPLGRQLIVKILTKSEVSIGGVALVIAKGKEHKEWSEKTLEAEVLRLGRDMDENDEVLVGDVVVFRGDAGRWLDKDLHEGEDTHRVIHYEELLAINEDLTPRLKENPCLTVH